MIREIKIENYKSIQQLSLNLGRLTVLIGANGNGKSNILEAIALSSAAANNKLDNEFLASRGIRITDDPRYMRAAFDKNNITKEIIVDISDDKAGYIYKLQNTNEPYSSWSHSLGSFSLEEIIKVLELFEHSYKKGELSKDQASIWERFRPLARENIKSFYLNEFLIYSPENSSLRIFEQEGQILPLGVKGEGLFKLLKVLNSKRNKERQNEIKERLKLLDWFNDFKVSGRISVNEKRLMIKDKYIDKKLDFFDQVSANEGFLFLLFYFTLFVSEETPKFFAIDNVDASLNPKLCSQLMIELNQLAKKYNKQAILTTHNPAILDGLDLNDDEQRLFVIYRNKLGHTKAERILKPKPVQGQEPVRLSEAFLRGYIGGLPKNF
jgi:AAA15 family ATPase/GTPase